MGLLDGPLRSVAKTLINVLGANATLRRRSSVYDAQHDLSTDTEESFALRISPPEPYASYRIDGTLILAGDAKCLVAASELESKGIVLPPGSYTNLYLDIGTDKWTVVRTTALRSGDQAAAVELHLRR